MPVRSLNLKMILSRGEAGREIRQALWSTHSAVNRAVAELEAVLLLCRGRAYCTGDDELVPGDEVRRHAIALAREVQNQNGRPGSGTDEEILAGLREWYEALVPSVLLGEDGKPLEGSAQAAGGFASPMMDTESQGFQSVFEKILDPLPGWIAKMQEGASGWEPESTEWLKSPESQQLQHASGSPPAWVRRLRASQPWQEAFIKDQEKKRKGIAGVPSLVRRLKSLGLLPLMPPPVACRFADKRAGLTPWDRLALRLAVAHLLSWESWNHRAAWEHRRVKDRLDLFRRTAEPLDDLLQQLREYETRRHEELKRIALADDSNPFRIGTRMLRAWDRVRDAWLGQKGATKARRLEVLGELQTRLRGRFGDPDLFRWLAEDGREYLWRKEDPLPVLARLNALERLLKRKKSYALYTAPHASLHPQWVEYEAPGGSNLRNYSLEVGEGRVALSLCLLVQSESGLAEKEFPIRLAPSGQLESPRWLGEDKKSRRLTFVSAHQEFSAELGGAKLTFKRRHLENRKPEELEHGDVGSVWCKPVLDVDSQAPSEWLDARGRLVTPPEVHHFNTALVNPSKHENLAPGLRVLSVDLGLRTFAVCSVFELVPGRPESCLAFLADVTRDLWARHERSFFLPLPGEIPDKQSLRSRRAAYDELGALRRDLGRLRALIRLSLKQTSEERREEVDALVNAILDEAARGPGSTMDPGRVRSLELALALAQPLWEGAVKAVYHEAETSLGLRIAQWRNATRPRANDLQDRMTRRAYAGGKSAWAIQYLDDLRRFLLQWSLRGRRSGEIRRLDRQRRGTFAARLLEHINALKDDRVKSGSDMIVQAARGYVPAGKKGWMPKYQPCRLILFEDLARYLFRTDRPRRENSQLMRWSHRRILAETTMQAEIYGIVVDTTGAGFSSQFHARTGAPGRRTRVLADDDFESPWVLEQLALLADRLKVDVHQLRPGTRVPWEGGEELLTLGPAGEAVVIHADLNAAQNLQRRFWTRHADAYRISAVEVKQGGSSHWYPDRDGVRLRGALSTLVGGDGYARLVPAGDGDGFLIEKVPKSQWARAVGGQAESGDEQGLDEADLALVEAAEGEDLERGGGRQTFFRDPSGQVVRRDRWYEAKVFWGRVERRLGGALRLVGD